MTTLEWALQYLASGFSVIPVGQDKKPVIPSWKEYQTKRADEATLREWFNDKQNFGVAIVTGLISGITVVDVDSKELNAFGLDGLNTPKVNTPRGKHYYFKYTPVKNHVGLIEKVDLRSDGGYVVAPGSNGYNWLTGIEAGLKDFPSAIHHAIISGTEKQISRSEVLPQVAHGGRNNYLASRAGVMRSKGFSYEVLLAALNEENRLTCVPPLSDKEVESIAKSVSRYEPGNVTVANTEAKPHDSLQGASPDPSILVPYSQAKDMKYEDTETIQTGIRSLDEYLAGGLGLKEVSLFVAPQATGKTTISCFIGANAKLQGYNVLHCFYEDQLFRITNRYKHHLRGDLTDTEVFFLDATRNPVNIPQIESYMKKTKPGLVILDYLMRIPILQKMTENRFEIKDLMMRFCNLARAYNCHVMILDHVTIKNEEPGEEPNYYMHESRISEAKMIKLAVSDIVIGFLRDRDNLNRLWITGMKMKREARSLFRSVRVNWTEGTYHE